MTEKNETPAQKYRRVMGLKKPEAPEEFLGKRFKYAELDEINPITQLDYEHRRFVNYSDAIEAVAMARKQEHEKSEQKWRAYQQVLEAGATERINVERKEWEKIAEERGYKTGVEHF